MSSASGSTDADSSGDAVSNPDAPAPLEDDEAETTEDNDEETDGITNRRSRSGIKTYSYSSAENGHILL